MYLWPGLHPTTHWRVYSTLPDPLTGFKRATLQQGVEGRGGECMLERGGWNVPPVHDKEHLPVLYVQ